MNSISWMKLPIVGAPGSECGRQLLEGGETRPVASFKMEFGACDEQGTWLAGMMFVCDKHAAVVAADFGDDFEEIKRAYLERIA